MFFSCTVTSFFPWDVYKTYADSSWVIRDLSSFEPCGFFSKLKLFLFLFKAILSICVCTFTNALIKMWRSEDNLGLWFSSACGSWRLTSFSIVAKCLHQPSHLHSQRCFCTFPSLAPLFCYLLLIFLGLRIAISFQTAFFFLSIILFWTNSAFSPFFFEHRSHYVAWAGFWTYDSLASGSWMLDLQVSHHIQLIFQFSDSIFCWSFIPPTTVTNSHFCLPV